MLRNSGAIYLPNEELIRNLLSRWADDHNLRYSGTEIFWYTHSWLCNEQSGRNRYNCNSALSIEIVCHHGGPPNVLHVHPVAKQNASEQHQMLLDATFVIKKKGGVFISLIFNNAPTNVKTFRLMGSPGKVTL